MLIGRQSSLSGAERQSLAEDAPGRRWRGPVRIAAYGLLGVLGLVVLLMGALIILARRPPPARLAELPGARSAPSPPAALPPAPSPAAAPDDAATDTDLQGVRTQVQAETAVLAALRDQADQARAELADLQQQQSAARAGLADLQQQQAAARAALDSLTSRTRAPPATPAEEAAAPSQTPTTPALDRALSRLRRQAAHEEPKPQPRQEAAHAEAAPLIMSPPPTILGQIPASAVDDDTPAVPAARPRVFLQYRAGSQGQEIATELARRLLFSDFAYAQMRAVPVSTPLPLIRYFHPEDAGAAQSLADLLRGDGIDFRVEYAAGASPEGTNGAIEVWLP